MYLQLAENEQPQLAGFFSKLKKLSLKKIVKGAVEAVKKVGLAIPRNAYLSLVGLNVKGLASKLKRGLESPDRDAILNKWKSLGGNTGDFQKAVAGGAKKKHLFEMADNGEEYGHVVLSEGEYQNTVRVQELSTPAAVAAIAAAAPIISALAPLVAKFAKKDDQPEGTQTIEQQAATITPDTFVDPTSAEHADKFETEEGVSIQKTSGGISTTTLLIGAAAVAAVYFISKKK